MRHIDYDCEVCQTSCLCNCECLKVQVDFNMVGWFPGEPKTYVAIDKLSSAIDWQATEDCVAWCCCTALPAEFAGYTSYGSVKVRLK